ncbi:MAG: DUF2249 domain-containing protein [Acidobacteria bacterium]|nr:DUF2249 domain-containing protein [Acidobacteriota bacterium]
MEHKMGVNGWKQINLLEYPHQECHVQVFRGLDEIGVGEPALVIADHDTRPVFYQYQTERGCSLSWQYEQEGPEVWKIRVTKGNGSAVKELKGSRLEELDVRHLPPPFRHKTIFEKFDGLACGQGFLLVNDHDPKPLYYELRSVRGENLDWEYVEQGPKVWRVKVIKTKDTDVGAGEVVTKFDVRQIPAPDRHPSIFHRFGTLRTGESMEIINDHDPRPLYEHFRMVVGDAFSWKYLEQGPRVWRAQITKKERAQPEGTRTHGLGEELDVRPYPPADRHRLIFEKYEGLTPGKLFILVNDHDPKPLYYQFAAEHEGAFSWEYIERGPAAWRVAIGKTSARR